MSTTTIAAETPYYVLTDGKGLIGPVIKPLSSGIECSSIYGFSSKRAYDKFCGNHASALKPYPLVKLYLRNQIAESDDRLNLVVLNASSSDEPCLSAATTESVLDAQEKCTAQVTAAYQLRFDQDADGYSLEEAAV